MNHRESDDRSARLAILQRADFLPHVGTEFSLLLDDDALLPLELIAVRDLDVRSRPESARAPFSLLFRGAADFYLPQRIYELNHPVMVEMDLFLVPIGPDDAGQLFEAVFN